MSAISDTVISLIKQGATEEMIRTVLDGYAAVQQEFVAATAQTTDPVAEKRRAYDRARKAAKKAELRAQNDPAETTGIPADSTGIPPESADGPIPSPKEKTPATPKTQPPSLPKENPLRGEKKGTPLPLLDGTDPPKPPRGTRLSPDWQPRRDEVEFGVRELRLTPAQVGFEAGAFRDHWLSKSGADATKLNWDLTFRNWLRNSLKFRGRSGPGGPKPNAGRYYSP